MRILLHDRSGHAFPVQLSRELARRGHKVLHSYGAFFQAPKGDLVKHPSDPEGFSVVGIHLAQPFQKYTFLKRWFQEREYARKLVEQIHTYDPEVLILAQLMPDTQAYVYRHLKNDRLRIIFWVQDLYGVAIQKLLRVKIFVIGHLIGAYYTAIERALLQKSDAVVLITEDFRPVLAQWGIPQGHISVIPNWGPVEQFPVRPKTNAWAKAQQLDDKLCFLYAGTMGMKHNPELLLELALHFRHCADVRVVVVSEGLGATWLQQKKKALNVDNLILMGFQPYEQMPDVFGTADVLVAVLEPEAGVFSVPSKVLAYLCASRPLLLAVPLENAASSIVLQHNAGLVVSPQDKAGFVEVGEKLLHNTELRRALGKNARHYAEHHFDISRIGDQFERIIVA